MKVIIQRSLDASCTINGNVTGKIAKGYVLLVGFTNNDNEEIISKMVQKIVNLRIFTDENDKLNLDIRQTRGSILSISQFTLYSKLSGRRPSFTDALNYNDAKDLYNKFNNELRKYDIKVEEGVFGEDMKISLINDGPVTIIVDSEKDF